MISFSEPHSSSVPRLNQASASSGIDAPVSGWDASPSSPLPSRLPALQVGSVFASPVSPWSSPRALRFVGRVLRSLASPRTYPRGPRSAPLGLRLGSASRSSPDLALLFGAGASWSSVASRFGLRRLALRVLSGFGRSLSFGGLLPGLRPVVFFFDVRLSLGRLSVLAFSGIHSGFFILGFYGLHPASRRCIGLPVVFPALAGSGHLRLGLFFHRHLKPGLQSIPPGSPLPSASGFLIVQVSLIDSSAALPSSV